MIGIAAVLACSASAASLGLGAFASNASASTSSINTKADITFALPPDSSSNFIFPIMGAQYYTNANSYQLQQLLFRPLYWFGKGTSPKLNTSLSLAKMPVFSNGDKTVTITLKKYEWSDGEPVTSRDVVFFMNLVKAAGANWGAYVTGLFPTNVASVTAPNASTVVFHLTKAYRPTWFLDNELSQISPLPQQSWDKESATGKVGNYDTAAAGAKAVFNFLTAQSEQMSTYATNPLWKVVDGPFQLKTFESSGYSVFTPNKEYSGPVKAKYAELILEPFTTDVAEFNSLKAGTLDYGYVPAYDASLIPELTSQGYVNDPWVSWGFNYMPVNFNNPTVGPLFRQLYIRQAFQYMVNQPVDIKKAMYGFGAPDYGPVPTAPATSFESSQAKVNPYPFDPSKAAALLKSHGWKVKVGGTSTCAKPGTGSSDCGAGISKGQQLSFNLAYPTGSTATTVMMEQYKTNLASAGIQLNLDSVPVNTVFSDLDKCTSGPSCKWQILSWSVGYTYGPNFMPTGEETFAASGSFNFGNYASPVNDANILATVTSGSSSAMFKYENYLEDQLPVIWQPKADAQISEISKSLKGVTQSPTLNFTPEDWTMSK